jgi:hypothetical protein
VEGSVNLMGESGRGFNAEQGARVLAEQANRTDLDADPALPAETRLWPVVQEVSGAPWGGRVFDGDWIWKENQCSYTALPLLGGFKLRPGLAFRCCRMRRSR